MTKKEIVERLIKEEKDSKASSAFFHVCSLRKRARSQIILRSLYYKMVKEGFNFDKHEYIPVIRLLSDLGFGNLMTDSRGKVIGLTDIKATLQTIGIAACGGDARFNGVKFRTRFYKLPTNIEKSKELEQKLQAELPIKVQENKSELSAILPPSSDLGQISFKMINIPMPKNLSTDQIADLMNKLKSA